MTDARPLDSFIQARRRELEAEHQAAEAERQRQRAADEEHRRQGALAEAARRRFEEGVDLNQVFSRTEAGYCDDFLCRASAAGFKGSYFYIAINSGFFRTSVEKFFADRVYNASIKEEQRRLREQHGEGVFGYPIGYMGLRDHYSYKEFDTGSPHLEREVAVLCGDKRLRTGTGKTPNFEGNFPTGFFEVRHRGEDISRSLDSYGTEFVHRYPYTIYEFNRSSIPESLAHTVWALEIG